MDYAMLASRLYFQVGDRKRYGDLFRYLAELWDIFLLGLPENIDIMSRNADDLL